MSTAEIRLGCLKLAAEFRTAQSTPEDLETIADQFLAYVTRGQGTASAPDGKPRLPRSKQKPRAAARSGLTASKQADQASVTA